MADVWTFSAVNDRFTLTLDGTGSGQESRSQTFGGLTAGGQYTFYMTVNPTASEVDAFLEIDGGARSTATTTGNQTLAVTGDADGSGNITLRFGVAEAGNAPGTLFFEDDLDYPDVATMEAAGWTKVESSGTVSIETGGDLDGNTNGVLKGSVVNDIAGTAYITRTLTTVIGRTYTATARLKNGQNKNFDTGTRIQWGGGPDVSHKTTTWTTKSVAKTATSTSTEIRIGRFSGYFGISGSWVGYAHGLQIDDGVGGSGATVDFNKITYCSGTGTSTTGGGTGAGDGGDDPVPDPDPPPGGYPDPPSPPTRPYGWYALPAGGLGVFTTTFKPITPTTAVNVLNAAATGDQMLFITFGPQSDWLDSSGQFQFSLWKARVDAVYNDARAKAAVDAAITSGAIFAHYVIDEPFLLKRWGVISFGTVERMCQYSKQLWSTMRTTLRVPPDKDQFTRHMDGLDDLMLNYSLSMGDVTTYRDRNITLAQGYNHGLVTGMNVTHFSRPNGGRAITASEYEHYGKILTSSSFFSAMLNWKYSSSLYNTAGMVNAIIRVRDNFASYDP